MKKLLLSFLTFVSAAAFAAGALVWQADHDAALRLAKTQNKPLLILFTASDWSPDSIRFGQEVLANPDFIKLADGKFVLYKADFPKRTLMLPGLAAKNKALKKKYKADKGYPTTIVISPSGAELMRAEGYLSGTADEYIESLKNIQTN